MLTNFTGAATSVQTSLAATDGCFFQASTKLQPKIVFEDSDPSLIGLEGVRLDVIETSVSLARNSSTPKRSLMIDQVIKFVEMYLSRTTTSSYPTEETHNLAIARCVIMDDRYYERNLNDRFSPQETLQRWIQWHEYLINNSYVTTQNTIVYTSADTKTEFQLRQFETRVFRPLRGRAYIITKLGYVRIGPADAQPGDVVAVFSGDSTAFVLRKAITNDSMKTSPDASRQSKVKRDGTLWQLVGDCYFHGFMDNEVAGSEWEDKRQIFWIV